MTFHQLCCPPWLSLASGPTGWLTRCSSSHLANALRGSVSGSGLGTIAGREDRAEAVKDVSFFVARDGHNFPGSRRDAVLITNGA
jgi:hypothetical protein